MLLDNRHAFFFLWHTMFCSTKTLGSNLLERVYSIIFHTFLPTFCVGFNGVNPKNSPTPLPFLKPPVSSVFRTWQPKSAVAPHSMKTCQNLGVPNCRKIWDEWLINLLGDYGPHDLDTWWKKSHDDPFRPRKVGAKMVVLIVNYSIIVISSVPLSNGLYNTWGLLTT